LGRILGIAILFFSGWCGLVSGINCHQQAFGQAQNIQPGQNQVRANPFLTLKEAKALVEMGNAIPLDYLNVSAIFYSAVNSQNRAIIDGKILVPGDSIDNKQVIKIDPEDVILEDSQGQYVAKMNKINTSAPKSE
jgi:hypothetical protein